MLLQSVSTDKVASIKMPIDLIYRPLIFDYMSKHEGVNPQLCTCVQPIKPHL